MKRLRFKDFMHERKEFSSIGTEKLLSVSEYYGIKPRAEASLGEFESRSENLEGYRKVFAGDFVMNYMLAWKGAYGVSSVDGIVSPAYAVFEMNDHQVNQRYIHYRLRTTEMQALFKSWSKGIIDSRLRLYPDTFLALNIEIPPQQTQKQIADFLDRETTRIDVLIEKKQRLVELIEEKRFATIANAVTKGLNPTVRMRDSGIEWIGAIPAHWDVIRLKYLGRAIIGLTYSPADITEESEGIPVLRASNIQRGRITFDDTVYVKSQIPSQLITREGDILICSRSGSRGLIGKNALIDYRSAGVSFGVFTTVFRSEWNRYLYYVLNSPLFAHQAGRYLTTTINQLTIETLKNFEVPLPPWSEADKICKYLRRYLETSEITIDKLLHSIGTLRELRSTLITAAVTGQIDIKMWSKRSVTNRCLEEEEMQA